MRFALLWSEPDETQMWEMRNISLEKAKGKEERKKPGLAKYLRVSLITDLFTFVYLDFEQRSFYFNWVWLCVEMFRIYGKIRLWLHIYIILFANHNINSEIIKPLNVCPAGSQKPLRLNCSCYIQAKHFFSAISCVCTKSVCGCFCSSILQPSTIVMDFSFCTQQMNNWKSHYIFMWSILQIIVFESASIPITASSAHSLGTFKSSKFIHSQRWTNTFSIGWNLTTFYYIKCARSAWKKTMTPSVLFVSLALSFLLTRIHHCMFYSYCVHIGDIFIHLLSHLGRYFRLLALQYLHTI